MYVVGAWTLLLLEQVHHCTTNSTTVLWHTHHFHSIKFPGIYRLAQCVLPYMAQAYAIPVSENINMPHIGAHASTVLRKHIWLC